MSDEVDKRIQAAAEQAVRTKETTEFLNSLKKGDELVRPIRNPEAWIMRDKLASAASRGELSQPECHHPLAYLQQYIDDDPSVKREGRPVNLFECGVCHMLLWITDPWGNAIGDA